MMMAEKRKSKELLKVSQKKDFFQKASHFLGNVYPPNHSQQFTFHYKNLLLRMPFTN